MNTKIIYIIVSLLLLAGNSAAKVYNIRSYGAVSDKTVLSTTAIQKTIDECHKQGGGTVWVPSGEYLSASLYLRSNVHLNLEAGATIYASERVTDYEGSSLQHGAADATTIHALIVATDCERISITGEGRLHGQGKREQFTRKAEFDPEELITGREIANAAKYGADYRTKYRRLPPSTGLINITNCKDVKISSIQLIEAGFWTLHLQWCERVQIQGLYIQSDPANGVNADGLDIDGCSSVTVSDCIIDTGDDALCLKSTLNMGKSQPCQDIVINNCLLRSSSAAFKIGTESHSDFKRIVVSNCVINGANRGLSIIVRDGGNVSDVKFSNIVINTERKATFWWGNGDPVWFIIANRTPESQTGSIRRITLDNITATGQSGIRLEGFSNAIEEIRFSNVQLRLETESAIDKRSLHGFHFYNLRDLTLEGCEMLWEESSPEPTWEKAFNFERIENLYLHRIKAEAAPGQPEAMRFKEITGDFFYD